MFGWGRVFKGRSHYVFDYKPRYYDERKERIEKLKAKYITTDEDSSDEKTVPSITFEKDNLKKAWKKSKSNSYSHNQTLLLAFIIAVLFGFFAYILDLHSLF